ncbi:hypothetical protein ACYULU_16395 [Breznakiellaceae bacterium SP9]
MKGPLLVVLAAGMGSRYGGLKQMEKLGRSGEVLLDFSVYDAYKSGFKKIVFIIRHDFEQDFYDIVLKRIQAKIACEVVFQELDSLLSPQLQAIARKIKRTKPWGTTHALLCAADEIDAPFALINADDFYGRESFAVLGTYLATMKSDDMGAIVPYRLERTLSPQGTVARGVCEVQNGYLTGVEECLRIQKKEVGIFNTYPDGSERELQPDTPVSMNFWGFPPALLTHFRTYWEDFQAEYARSYTESPKAECLVPLAVDLFIKKKILKVKTLSADSDWFGVTYKEDRAAAVKRIEALTEAGVYPPSLWGSC